MKGKIARRLARYLNRRDAELAGQTAVITFTFDDAYSAACKIGAGIVESGGGRATYYVCGGFDRSPTSDPRYHSAADLRCLQGRGHEIACHGYAHLNYQETGTEEIQRDLDLNARYFEECEILPPRNFAYPFGCVSPRVKSLCSDRFRSLRGVEASVNRHRVDLSLLKSVPLYSSSIKPADIRLLVEQTRDTRSWLIFFAHDVTNAPNYFDVTPDLLSFAVTEAVRCNLPILSMDAALDYYGL
ncbi:MAG TPA: polysaccharide deacetylase family protein [Sphingomicrobium sp.]|nr:polysaccharide deacetylase family protein [Sphingomicrobium sp.]